MVLINRRTASAAEILAGSLSLAGRVLLLGEQTWGKGTVQKLHPLKDGSALKLTIAQYLTPGDVSIQSVGITLVIDEEQMSAATALCACGTAFFLRAIRAASQGGIEIGFHARDALAMAAQTAKAYFAAAEARMHLNRSPSAQSVVLPAAFA